jgi:hypothetical protein
MSQTPKERAREQLAFYEREAEKLRFFIELYDLLEGTPPEPDMATVGGSVPMQAVMKPESAQEAPFATSDEIVEAVREILKGETEPMHISYLYKLVTAKGLRISGQNPKGNLSAKLAPYKNVVKYVRNGLTGKAGWLLVEPSPKVEAPNGTRPNGASNHGEGGTSPNSNPAQRGA